MQYTYFGKGNTVFGDIEKGGDRECRVTIVKVGR